MTSTKGACLRGGLVGLAMGIAVIIVAWYAGDEDSSELLRFLIAAPPFLFNGFLNTPEPIQALVVVTWWGLAGAVIGWAYGHSPGGKIITLVAAVIVVIAQLMSQAAIVQDLGTVANSMERLLLELFGF